MLSDRTVQTGYRQIRSKTNTRNTGRSSSALLHPSALTMVPGTASTLNNIYSFQGDSTIYLTKCLLELRETKLNVINSCLKKYNNRVNNSKNRDELK